MTIFVYLARLHGIYELVSCFEGSLTSFSKIILKFLDSSIGRVFKHIKLFLNSYFAKPLPIKGGWMGDYALYAFNEYLSNMCTNGW